MTTASNTAATMRSQKRRRNESPSSEESERPRKRIVIKTSSTRQRDVPERPDTPMAGIEKTGPQSPGTPVPSMKKSQASSRAQMPQHPKQQEADLYSPEVSPVIPPRKLPNTAKPAPTLPPQVEKSHQPKKKEEDLYSPQASPVMSNREFPGPARPAPQRVDYKQPLTETKDCFGWTITLFKLEHNPARKDDAAFREPAEYLQQAFWEAQNANPPNYRATMYYLQELHKVAEKYGTKKEAEEIGAMTRLAQIQKKRSSKQQKKGRPPVITDYASQMACKRGIPSGAALKAAKEKRGEVKDMVKEHMKVRKENGMHEFVEGWKKWRTLDDEEFKEKERRERQRKEEALVGEMVDWAVCGNDREGWRRKMNGLSGRMRARIGREMEERAKAMMKEREEEEEVGVEIDEEGDVQMGV